MTQPVFISYAHAESAPAAQALSDALGPDVAFFDDRHLECGGELPSTLVKALLAARVVVVFPTVSYFNSWYCRRELRICLAAYDALVGSGAEPEHREDALAHVVVALPSRPGPEVLARLPPGLRRRLWPTPDETERLVALVRTRLQVVSLPLGERIEGEGLGAKAEAFVDQAGTAAALNLGGVSFWGPPGEPRPSLGDSFVGRADELWKIHDILHSGGAKMAGLTGSIEGGGGYGKTQLAAEYLHRFGPTFYPGGLFWVRADLDLLPQLHGMLSYLEPATPDLRAFMKAGRDAWSELGVALGRRAAQKAVLYIVDNVPEPDPGTMSLPLSTWCPATGKVALLVTSRATQMLAGSMASLRVEVLPPGPAVELLTREYGRHHRLKLKQWQRIADWVGNLPLALEILNASLRTRALEPEELLAMVTAPPVAEVDRISEVLNAVVPAAKLREITKAFMVSYERLDSDVQQAARLLALLGPFPIPLAILKAFGSELSSPRVRATLGTRSLLTEVAEPTDDVAFLGRMHSVLADFLRARATDPHAEQYRVCEALTEIMDLEHCASPRSWPLMNACLPHAEQLFWRVEQVGNSAHVQPLINLGLAIGNLFSAEGLVRRAAEVEEKALQLAVESGDMDVEHPIALNAMNNLALSLHDRGDLPAARELQEQVLGAARRLLGNDHPNTLNAMNNLALTLHAQGDLPAARELQEQVVDASRRLLGDDHPDTHMATGNLAVTLHAQGDLPAARDLQEQVLDAARRLLGGDHPGTLQAVNNLARTLHAQGDLPAARELQEQVVDASRRLLGNDHPNTLSAIDHLAVTVRAQGDLPAARELQEQVVDASRRLLGDDHPDTHMAMGNLAVTLHAHGDLPAARELQEQVLDALRRLLGDDHPDVLRAMNNLALTVHAQGDLVIARLLYEQVLSDSRRLLGDDHPDTLTVMVNLATTVRTQGDLPAARGLQEQILVARKRLLGLRHPATTTSAWNLFSTLVDLGDGQAAREVLGENLWWVLDGDPAVLASSQQQVASWIRSVLDRSVKQESPSVEA